MNINYAIIDYVNKHRCGFNRFVCFIVITLFLMCIMTVFVKTGMMDLFWNILCDFSALLLVTKDTSIAMANWLTAIATIGALLYARRAYKQSQRARKNASFSSLFAQLLTNHKHIFGKKVLESTELKTSSDVNKLEDCLGGNPSDDTFASFFNYYKAQHENLIPKPNQMPSSTIAEIWDYFVNSIKEESKFSNCFKYVFYELKTVMDEKSLDEIEKKHYIGIIQANMTYDELFCYFINLIQHYSRNCCNDENYLESLYNIDFFENIMSRPDFRYRTYIEELKKSAVGSIVCKIVGK